MSDAPNPAENKLDKLRVVDPDWGADSKGISIGTMFRFVADQTDVVNSKLSALKSAGSSISITDMFEMQMKMNRLSQFSEMATSVVSAAGTAISSIARNVK